MYVAIEGMDGVGKTTIASMISNNLKMEYIEKPMKKFMNCDDVYYDNLCNFMFGLDNQDITLCFYMLGNIVTKHLGNDIVVDRNILSAYYWDCNEYNKEIFNYFLSKNVFPDITIILYADPDTRVARIKNRNQKDEDLSSEMVLQDGYGKMIDFAEEVGMPYVIIDTSNMSIDEVAQECCEIIEKLKNEKERKETELDLPKQRVLTRDASSKL